MCVKNIFYKGRSVMLSVINRIVLFYLIIVLLSACSNDGDDDGNFQLIGQDSNSGGSTDSDSDSDSDGDTDTDIDADTDADADSDADADGDGDTHGVENFGTDSKEVCDAKDLNIEPTPGRLMFLLDMSSSMLDGTPTKMEQAVTAVTNVLLEFEGQGIEFGLDLFPDGSLDPKNTTRCGVNNDVVIDCDMNTEQAIIEELNKTHITGATPLYCAMNNFTDPSYAPQYSGVRGNNILVIVTDGEDNCFMDCQEGTQLSSNTKFGELAESLCNSHGVKTVAVGFGSEALAGQLNAVAEKGCTEYTEYIQADDQEELQDALELLTGLAIGCNFFIGELDEQVDPTLVNIYFDDEIVKHDPGCAAGTGWSWASDSHDEITFCEEACAKINSGDVSSVTAKFGCKTVFVV
jgi:hypothetical protein